MLKICARYLHESQSQSCCNMAFTAEEKKKKSQKKCKTNKQEHLKKNS